jgi:hypothetical protein
MAPLAGSWHLTTSVVVCSSACALPSHITSSARFVFFDSQPTLAALLYNASWLESVCSSLFCCVTLSWAVIGHTHYALDEMAKQTLTPG